MAVGEKPGTASVRILPLKLKECDVPPKIVTSLYLDISRARTRDQEIVKLLRDLVFQKIASKLCVDKVVKKPWWFLVELLTEPSALDQLAGAEDKLDQLRQSNEILLPRNDCMTNYKISSFL